MKMNEDQQNVLLSMTKDQRDLNVFRKFTIEYLLILDL